MTKRVRLYACPQGLFWHDGVLCFKTEYHTATSSNPMQPDAYVVASGEYFWGGTKGDSEARSNLLVTPVHHDEALRLLGPSKPAA